jgi:hypothetical protein
MKSVFEIIKENRQWEKFQQEVKNQYTHKEVQEGHLSNMRKFLERIQIKENWNAEIWGDTNDDEYYYDMFVDVVIKDERDDRILFLTIELNTFGNKCELEVDQIVMYFDFYNIDIEATFLEKVEERADFTELLSKYEELNKIFEGAVK